MKINDDFGNFRKGNREIESRIGIVIASRGDNQSRSREVNLRLAVPQNRGRVSFEGSNLR